MKAATTPVLALLSAVLLLACGAHDHEHGDSHAGHAAASEHDLALNGTQKWPMDEHTRSVFKTMSRRLEGKDLAAANAVGLQATGEALQQDIKDLIAGCTMQGAAHDELHKYLTLYIPAVTALAEKGEKAGAQKVHTLLALYPQYFE